MGSLQRTTGKLNTNICWARGSLLARNPLNSRLTRGRRATYSRYLTSHHQQSSTNLNRWGSVFTTTHKQCLWVMCYWTFSDQHWEEIFNKIACCQPRSSIAFWCSIKHSDGIDRGGWGVHLRRYSVLSKRTSLCRPAILQIGLVQWQLHIRPIKTFAFVLTRESWTKH